MNLFAPKLKADPQKVQAIKNWVYCRLAIDADVPISISQLACKESGCPPIETVIAVMTTPVQQYNVHKAVHDINETDLCGLG